MKIMNKDKTYLFKFNTIDAAQEWVTAIQKLANVKRL
jgi:hypothetical protein